MKYYKCIHSRKVVQFMKEFVQFATEHQYRVFLNPSHSFNLTTYDFMRDNEIRIGYNFQSLTDLEFRQVKRDLINRCPSARGFADITFTLLHEIGHFMTRSKETYEKQIKALRELKTMMSPNEINYAYVQLPSERVATDWAIEWLEEPENRKFAKAFEKRFFSCFEKPKSGRQKIQDIFNEK